jgi:hypothetical protein
MTINWHDRSIAPERRWDKCYSDLVQDRTAGITGAIYLDNVSAGRPQDHLTFKAHAVTWGMTALRMEPE